MPVAAWFSLHFYGPAASAGVAVGAGQAIPSARATARLGEVATGAGSVPFAKPTRLRNSPMVASGFGVMVRALPKARARPGMIVKIGALSQDDVTGAVLEARVEGDVTLKQALRLLLAYVAGDATGLDGNPIFRSLDGTKDRIAGTISGGNRNVTTVDPS